MTCEKWCRHTEKICVVFDLFQIRHPQCGSLVPFVSIARSPVYVSIEIYFISEIVSWDILVGIVTRLWAGRTSVWILVGREIFSSLHPPSPQPPVCWVLRPLTPRGKVARGVSLTTHIHLVLWGAIPPPSLYAFMVCAGTLYLYLVPLIANRCSGSEECKFYLFLLHFVSLV
jgi:hypothetical protein